MIQDISKYKDCICCQKGDKQTISLQEYSKGKTGQSVLASHHIIFVLKGAVTYSISGPLSTAITMYSGKFIFFPASTNMIWEALEDATVLLFRLNHIIGELSECHTFRFQRLVTCQIENQCAYPLRMNKRIRYFINGIVATERDGLKCMNYAKHLVAQLLTMIQVYYPQKEYMRFYSAVASADVMFTDLVYENWIGCRSVGELANISQMTVQQFTLHFIKVFGENPGAWLQNRRKEYVYHDICSSHKSLSQIATEHGFSTMSNFIRYCHMNYNTTPSAIRKSLIVKVPDKKQALVQPGKTG